MQHLVWDGLFPSQAMRGTAPRQRQLLRGVVGLTVAAGVPGGAVILWPFVEGRILS